MAKKEYLNNYLYILNYENTYDENGNSTIAYYAIDTHYMITCQIFKERLLVIIINKEIPVRNISKIKVIQRGDLVVLFKLNDGRYLISDSLCNLNIMTLQDIKNNRNKFPDVKFIGKGLTTGSGAVPNINKRAYNNFQMNQFNSKAYMIGISTLDYYLDCDNDIVISGSSNLKDKLIIPNFVTKMDPKAFQNAQIKHLVIGNSINLIRENTFSNCQQLENVVLGDSVYEIDEFAFFMCTKLSKVKFNRNLEIIKQYAFCKTSIEQLVVSGRLMSIRAHAFKESKLKYIDISDTNIKKLDQYAFERIAPVILKLPKELKTLNLQNLYNYKNLKELYIPDSLETLTGDSSVMFINMKKYISDKIKNKQLSSITAQSLIEYMNDKTS